MSVTPAQRRAKDKYNKKNYINISVRVRPEFAELLTTYCDNTGNSKASTIIKAVTKYITEEEQNNGK